MQITQGSDRSTCHRHPWSCRFITVATSATGHVDRLLWRAALHQTQLLGGGPSLSHALSQRQSQHLA